MLLPIAIAAVVGYLLGAIPFGYLVARSRGVNIFEVGSRNPGATNVRRVLGRGPGNLVFALDALKGAVATGWPLVANLVSRPAAGGTAYLGNDPTPCMVAGLIAALFGHSFSCFTHFKGGKGVATGAGGFVVLFPLGALVAVVVWGATAGITRYVSLASMMAGVGLTVAAWLLHKPPLVLGVCAVVMVFVVIRHRTNIARLIAGTETKIGRQKTAKAQP
ncbi:MAG: plsY [Verrucomicrobia bacterium]|nr:plsY [Verrucomicrobiota bacterium]